MKRLILSVCLACVCATSLRAQTYSLAWDASPDQGRVLEYRVWKNGVMVSSLPLTDVYVWVIAGVAPGETIALNVNSYGYKKDDATGVILGETGDGPLSPTVFFIGPVAPPPPPPPLTVSADGATCNVLNSGCQLVDTGLHVWTLSPSSLAILRDAQQWNGGFSDWLLWYGAKVYAYRSDTNMWWLDRETFWESFPYDPRVGPPPPPPPVVLTCVWTDGRVYAAGQVSPSYTVQSKQWSKWYASMQLRGWITNVGPNADKRNKNLWTGNLYCLGK